MQHADMTDKEREVQVSHFKRMMAANSDNIDCKRLLDALQPWAYHVLPKHESFVGRILSTIQSHVTSTIQSCYTLPA